MKKLQYAALNQAQQSRNAWLVKVEEGVTVEDIVNPLFWSHVSKKLNAYDRIEVVSRDGTFYAELLVLRRTDTAAKVKLINFVELQNEDYSALYNALNDVYFVKFMDSKEWCVLQKTEKGNSIVKEGLPSQAEAEKFRQFHMKAIAA